jgi:hypothetical protein
MKNKNVIFKFLAVVVAVGGAIISMQANASLITERPHVKYQTPSGTFCTTVSVNACTTTSNIAQCKVQIEIGPGGPQSTVQAWNHGVSAACDIRQFNTNGSAVGPLKTLPSNTITVLQ